MLKTVFTLNLNEKILPRRVGIGTFDGVNPCIVAATSTDKVIVHNPHNRSAQLEVAVGGSASDVAHLNINQTVQTLCTGKLNPNFDGDVLMIGTPTSILVYDVQNNRDLFYREIPDGANAVVIGTVGSFPKPLAISGGNCALQGFDWEGNDAYWTVTGDMITAIALADVDDDGQNELIVGSEDYDIRIFKEDAILYELAETDAITFLCHIAPETFAYSLKNGTLGVYHKRERLWRIKSKNQAVCIYCEDINGDGVPEILTGWSNGKVDGRAVETGEVLFKDSLGQAIAGIMKGDYNLDGIQEIIVCNIVGQVKGYVPAAFAAGGMPPQIAMRPGVLPVHVPASTAPDPNAEQEAIRDLMKRKHNLQLELRNYEENNRIVSDAAASYQHRGKASSEDDSYGAIPANTQLKSSLVINTSTRPANVDLNLQTNNDTIIRAVIIFGEGVFAGESRVFHPSDHEVDSEMNLPLRPPKDCPVDLHVKALVGYRNSFHYHVFELTRHLPRFSMYAFTRSHIERPQGSVTFNYTDRVGKITQWLNENFLLVEEFDPEAEVLDLKFVGLRDGKPLTVKYDSRSTDFTIGSDSMELAGDILQSFCSDYLKLDNLQSVANFPTEIEKLKQLITRVEDLQSVRNQLAADIADNSGLVRSLVIRAEDARLLKEFEKMRQMYMELHQINRELINEYKIRARNHQDLVDALKQVNVIIQRAGNLRVGTSKTQLIQACRLAIKQNNMNSLTRIIASGEF